MLQGMKVVVTGSHGLIGSSLTAALNAKGHTVVRLTHTQAGAHNSRAFSAARGNPGINATWDIPKGELSEKIFDDVGAVVHLAGAGIGDKRWSSSRKSEILQSRTLSTRLMATVLAGLRDPPPVLLSASAVGYYGDCGDNILTESSPLGTGFLAGVCNAWEEATAPAKEAGIRVVLLRTGIVQSPSGGMLARILPLFRMGLGGHMGSGRHYISWISIAEEVRAIEHAIAEESLFGPVNLTAPNPVTAADYARTLAAVLGRRPRFHVPASALKILMGADMARELLLSSQRALPSKIEDSGFAFKWPDLEGALTSLLEVNDS